MTRRYQLNRGFTLMELLIVIAIIMLIAGFMLPVLSQVRKASYRAQAREIVTQIAAAWSTYYTDNRSFPDVDITQMDEIGCAYVNTNLVSNGSVSMLDITRKESREGIKDHWGGIYQVILDNGKGLDNEGYDGQITVPGGQVIQRSVAVWSKGADGQSGTSDDIRSW